MGTRKYPPELRERAVRLYRESEPKPVIRRLAEQRGDAARSGQCPPRVETTWQPFAFLTVGEEPSGRR